MLKPVYILCLCFLLIIITSAGSAWDEPAFVLYNGVITGISGEADIKKSGQRSWVKAENGYILSQADVIKIGDGSFVDMQFSRKGKASFKIRLRDNSNLTFTSLMAGNADTCENIMLDLAIGDILIRVDKLPEQSKFRVRTPTSMVGVKGTRFEVKHGKPGE
ncbi:MAG: FecR domain-containing protein [Candidatus Omnitrophica bacterium]|jgi:hypothetical protein|nr:FecR domain-containing protein [Candidatus Omnitrophota bacterium]